MPRTRPPPHSTARSCRRDLPVRHGPLSGSMGLRQLVVLCACWLLLLLSSCDASNASNVVVYSCFAVNAVVGANATATVHQDLTAGGGVPSACNRSVPTADAPSAPSGVFVLQFTIENITLEPGSTLVVNVSSMRQNVSNASFVGQVQSVAVVMRNVRIEASATLLVVGDQTVDGTTPWAQEAAPPFRITADNCSVVNGLLALQWAMPPQSTTEIRNSYFELSDVVAAGNQCVATTSVAWPLTSAVSPLAPCVVAPLVLSNLWLAHRSSLTVRDSLFVGADTHRGGPLALNGSAVALLAISGVQFILDNGSSLAITDVRATLNVTTTLATLWPSNGSASVIVVVLNGTWGVRNGSSWVLQRVDVRTTNASSVLYLFNAGGDRSSGARSLPPSSTTGTMLPHWASTPLLLTGQNASLTIEDCAFMSVLYLDETTFEAATVVDLQGGILATEGSFVVRRTTMTMACYRGASPTTSQTATVLLLGRSTFVADATFRMTACALQMIHSNTTNATPINGQSRRGVLELRGGLWIGDGSLMDIADVSLALQNDGVVRSAATPTQLFALQSVAVPLLKYDGFVVITNDAQLRVDGLSMLHGTLSLVALLITNRSVALVQNTSVSSSFDAATAVTLANAAYIATLSVSNSSVLLVQASTFSAKHTAWRTDSVVATHASNVSIVGCTFVGALSGTEGTGIELGLTHVAHRSHLVLRDCVVDAQESYGIDASGAVTVLQSSTWSLRNVTVHARFALLLGSIYVGSTSAVLVSDALLNGSETSVNMEQVSAMWTVDNGSSLVVERNVWLGNRGIGMYHYNGVVASRSSTVVFRDILAVSFYNAIELRTLECSNGSNIVWQNITVRHQNHAGVSISILKAHYGSTVALDGIAVEPQVPVPPLTSVFFDSFELGNGFPPGPGIFATHNSSIFFRRLALGSTGGAHALLINSVISITDSSVFSIEDATMAAIPSTSTVAAAPIQLGLFGGSGVTVDGGSTMLFRNLTLRGSPLLSSASALLVWDNPTVVAQGSVLTIQDVFVEDARTSVPDGISVWLQRPTAISGNSTLNVVNLRLNRGRLVFAQSLTVSLHSHALVINTTIDTTMELSQDPRQRGVALEGPVDVTGESVLSLLGGDYGVAPALFDVAAIVVSVLTVQSGSTVALARFHMLRNGYLQVGTLTVDGASTVRFDNITVGCIGTGLPCMQGTLWSGNRQSTIGLWNVALHQPSGEGSDGQSVLLLGNGPQMSNESSFYMQSVRISTFKSYACTVGNMLGSTTIAHRSSLSIANVSFACGAGHNGFCVRIRGRNVVSNASTWALSDAIVAASANAQHGLHLEGSIDVTGASAMVWWRCDVAAAKYVLVVSGRVTVSNASTLTMEHSTFLTPGGEGTIAIGFESGLVVGVGSACTFKNLTVTAEYGVWMRALVDVYDASNVTFESITSADGRFSFQTDADIAIARGSTVRLLDLMSDGKNDAPFRVVGSIRVADKSSFLMQRCSWLNCRESDAMIIEGGVSLTNAATLLMAHVSASALEQTFALEVRSNTTIAELSRWVIEYCDFRGATINGDGRAVSLKGSLVIVNGSSMTLEASHIQFAVLEVRGLMVSILNASALKLIRVATGADGTLAYDWLFAHFSSSPNAVFVVGSNSTFLIDWCSNPGTSNVYGSVVLGGSLQVYERSQWIVRDTTIGDSGDREPQCRGPSVNVQRNVSVQSGSALRIEGSQMFGCKGNTNAISVAGHATVHGVGSIWSVFNTTLWGVDGGLAVSGSWTVSQGASVRIERVTSIGSSTDGGNTVGTPCVFVGAQLALTEVASFMVCRSSPGGVRAAQVSLANRSTMVMERITRNGAFVVALLETMTSTGSVGLSGNSSLVLSDIMLTTARGDGEYPTLMRVLRVTMSEGSRWTVRNITSYPGHAASRPSGLMAIGSVWVSTWSRVDLLDIVLVAPQTGVGPAMSTYALLRVTTLLIDSNASCSITQWTVEGRGFLSLAIAVSQIIVSGAGARLSLQSLFMRSSAASIAEALGLDTDPQTFGLITLGTVDVDAGGVVVLSALNVSVEGSPCVSVAYVTASSSIGATHFKAVQFSNMTLETAGSSTAMAVQTVQATNASVAWEHVDARLIRPAVSTNALGTGRSGLHVSSLVVSGVYGRVSVSRCALYVNIANISDAPSSSNASIYACGMIVSALNVQRGAVVALDNTTVEIVSLASADTSIPKHRPKKTRFTCFCVSLIVFGFGGAANVSVCGNRCHSPDGVWNADSLMSVVSTGGTFSASCNGWRTLTNAMQWFPSGAVTTEACADPKPSATSSASQSWQASATRTLPLVATASRTLSCAVEPLALWPTNRTTTTLLSQPSGAHITISIAPNGGGAFAGWWCAMLATGAPAATIGIVTVMSYVATISGVTAQIAAADHRCTSITVALHSTAQTPRRGTFTIPVHLSPRAFGCFVVGGATVTLTATYEEDPIVPLPAQAAVEAAVVVAALPIGSLGGAGIAAGMQRALLQLRLASCEFDLTDALDVASNPLAIRFGMERGQYLRGSVVGNVVLLVACAVGSFVAVAVRRWAAARKGRAMSFGRAGASLALPGWMVVPLGLLLQPLVSSSLALVVHSDAMSGAKDVVLGVIGLAIGATLTAVVAHLVTRGFGAEAVRFDSSDDDTDAALEDKRVLAQLKERIAGHPNVRRLLEFFRPRFTWRDRQSGSLFTKRFRVVFEAYKPHRQWFVAIELGLAMTTGFIGGVMPNDGDTCFGLIVAMTVLNGAMLLGICVLRPFNARLDATITGCMTLAATVWSIASLSDNEALAAVAALVEVWLAVAALAFMCFELAFSPRAARSVRRMRRLLLWCVSCCTSSHFGGGGGGGALTQDHGTVGLSAALAGRQDTPNHVRQATLAAAERARAAAVAAYHRTGSMLLPHPRIATYSDTTNLHALHNGSVDICLEKLVAMACLAARKKMTQRLAAPLASSTQRRVAAGIE